MLTRLYLSLPVGVQIIGVSRPSRDMAVEGREPRAVPGPKSQEHRNISY